MVSTGLLLSSDSVTLTAVKDQLKSSFHSVENPSSQWKCCQSRVFGQKGHVMHAILISKATIYLSIWAKNSTYPTTGPSPLSCVPSQVLDPLDSSPNPDCVVSSLARESKWSECPKLGVLGPFWLNGNVPSLELACPLIGPFCWPSWPSSPLLDELLFSVLFSSWDLKQFLLAKYKSDLFLK